ncbi:TrmH family RNA methyltransferase [Candidatus Saccharibacteria bacterium]|nr:TrmH family RNA methyltransferase [Candidatus Saccharibacteria bacterium]
MIDRRIILIAHNVRSAYNVGSLLRTADGLKVEVVYLTGYTPYPQSTNDRRIPHEQAAVMKKIEKSALGAEGTARWEHVENIYNLLKEVKRNKFQITALEQTAGAKDLHTFSPPSHVALVVGNELTGLEEALIELSDVQLQIPMFGKKESFNVSVASAIALYHLRFTP